LTCASSQCAAQPVSDAMIAELCTSRAILLHGERTQSKIMIVLYCRLNLSFICCLLLLGYERIK